MIGNPKMIVGAGAVGLAIGLGGAWLVFASKRPERSESSAPPPARTPVDPARFVYESAKPDGPASRAISEAVADSTAAIKMGDPQTALKLIAEIEDDTARTEALLTLIDSLDAGGIEALVTYVIQVTEGGRREDEFATELIDEEVVAFAMLERWVRLDPEAYFETVSGFENEEMSMILSVLGTGFIFQDGQELGLARLEALKSSLPEETWEEIDEALPEIAGFGRYQADPIGTLNWLRENYPEFDDYDDLIEKGAVDPVLVWDEVRKIENEKGRWKAMGEVLSQWMKRSPQQAFDAALEIGDREVRGRARNTIIGEWVRHDPQEAMKQALANGRSMVGIKAWLEFDTEAATTWATQNLGPEMIGHMVAQNSEMVPFGRAQELLGNLSPSELGSVLAAHDRGRYLVTDWIAQGEAPAAFDWVAAQVRGGAIIDAQVGVILGEALIAGGDDSVSEKALSLPPGMIRDGILEQVAQRAGRVDPGAGERWLASLPVDVSDGVSEAFYATWSASDPQTAYQSARESGNQGAMGAVVEKWLEFESPAQVYLETVGEINAEGSVLRPLLQAWAVEDPAAAAGAFLADGAPEPEIALAEIFDRWARDDSTQATVFISDRLEGGELRDSAVSGLVGGLIRGKEYAEAQRWIDSIESPSEKSAAEEKLLRAQGGE